MISQCAFMDLEKIIPPIKKLLKRLSANMVAAGLDCQELLRKERPVTQLKGSIRYEDIDTYFR
ncbi:MAG: hypothetical protein ACJA0H_001593 [Francisellaceae bacterium]|jgi:hypothetical protein